MTVEIVESAAYFSIISGFSVLFLGYGFGKISSLIKFLILKS